VSPTNRSDAYETGAAAPACTGTRLKTNAPTIIVMTAALTPASRSRLVFRILSPDPPLPRENPTALPGSVTRADSVGVAKRVNVRQVFRGSLRSRAAQSETHHPEAWSDVIARRPGDLRRRLQSLPPTQPMRVTRWLKPFSGPADSPCLPDPERGTQHDMGPFLATHRQTAGRRESQWHRLSVRCVHSSPRYVHGAAPS